MKTGEDMHPYRTSQEPVQPKAAGRWQRFRRWARETWTGDDGHEYAVIVEPSIFRRGESRLLGPYTRRQAWWVSRRFVSHNPHGEARGYKLPLGTSWPPKTNWDREKQVGTITKIWF